MNNTSTESKKVALYDEEVFTRVLAEMQVPKVAAMRKFEEIEKLGGMDAVVKESKRFFEDLMRIFEPLGLNVRIYPFGGVGAYEVLRSDGGYDLNASQIDVVKKLGGFYSSKGLGQWVLPLHQGDKA